MKVIIENKYISDIPILEIYNPDTKEKKRPLVFVMHGLGSLKERNLEYGYRLVQDGFFAVSFDAFMHGEQITEEFKNKDSFEKFLNVFDIARETTKYIDIIIENYKDDKRIDTNRMGLIGVSMGGFIIYDYLANNKEHNIKAAVPIISSPYWSNTSKTFVEKNPETNKYFDEEKFKFIESIEPINSLKAMRDFPLLMLNGENDELIAIEGVRKSFGMIEKSYINKELIKLIEYKGVGHERAPMMIFDACSWLKKFV